MLRKTYRLRSRREFKLAYAKGRSFVHPMMVLYVRPTRLGVCRFGYSISKKLGGAVVRNRIKRRLREACRSRLPEIAPGLDFIIVGRSRLRDASFPEVEGVVGVLLARAKAIRPGRPAAAPAQSVVPSGASAPVEESACGGSPE